MTLSDQEYYLTSSRTEENDSWPWSFAPVGAMVGEFDEGELDPPLTVDQRRAIVEETIGPVDWVDFLCGHCTCPGTDLHTTQTRSNHCTVYAEGWLTIHCYHTSCSEIRKEIERGLRRRLPGEFGPRPTTTSGPVVGRRVRRIEGRVKAKLPTILLNFSLPEEGLASAVVATSSVSIPNLPEEQTRLFLRTMFAPDDVVWIGDKFHSGKPCYQSKFRTVTEWMLNRLSLGEFTCASTFIPGSFRRGEDNIVQQRYAVIESDQLSFGQTIGVFRFLDTLKGWRLRAIVWSGNKSLHGWFEGAPLRMLRDELAAIVRGLSCDPAPLRRSQPVRLAGVRRADTGHHQALLYLSPALHGI